jgi:hypothetical protein
MHANPKGIFFKLGLYNVNENVLLAGPSNTGLADPGHGAAISLTHITTTLLMTQYNIDRLVICKILLRLVNQIGEEFLATQLSLENQNQAK